jgi:DNA-binding transcriptional ArsR family regulator
MGTAWEQRHPTELAGEKVEIGVTIAPTNRKDLYAVVHSLKDRIAIFRAMAHPCRLHMPTLSAEGQVCDVTTLMYLCGRHQPYISQQLGVLRDAGLVIGSQERQRSCSRLADQRVKAVLQAAGVLENELAILEQ